MRTGSRRQAYYARFALDNFPVLTTRPGQIKALRQTILDLAERNGRRRSMRGRRGRSSGAFALSPRRATRTNSIIFVAWP